MADIADQSELFKDIIGLMKTEVIDQYKGTVTEQTLGTMLIGLTTAALDKAFQKPLLDKDLELKEAQKALINSQKTQYDLYPKVKKSEFLANMTGLAMTGGLDPSESLVQSALNTINALDGTYVPPL